MLSIIDVKDFIDLDHETVDAVRQSLGLPAEESIALAQQLLASESGLTALHHIFRDLIVASGIASQPKQEREMRQAYAHFSRKYPLPHILGAEI